MIESRFYFLNVNQLKLNIDTMAFVTRGKKRCTHNDFRPVAHTPSLAKCFERLVLSLQFLLIMLFYNFMLV